jgi:hypothetical protein
VPDLTLQEQLRNHPYRFVTGPKDRVGLTVVIADASAVDQRYAVLRERPAGPADAGCVGGVVAGTRAAEGADAPKEALVR